MDGATIQCSQLQDEIKCSACPEENRDRRSMLENVVQQAHTWCVCVSAFVSIPCIYPNNKHAHWIRTDRKMIMFTSDGFFPSVARFRNEHSILIQQPPELFKSFRCQCTRVSFLPPSLTNILHWNVPWAAGSHGFERAFEWLGNRMCERICFN